MTDDVDVVVTDGFTGNVVLKTLEGGLKAIVGALLDAFAAEEHYKAHAEALMPALLPLYEHARPRHLRRRRAARRRRRVHHLPRLVDAAAIVQRHPASAARWSSATSSTRSARPSSPAGPDHRSAAVPPELGRSSTRSTLRRRACRDPRRTRPARSRRDLRDRPRPARRHPRDRPVDDQRGPVVRRRPRRRLAGADRAGRGARGGARRAHRRLPHRGRGPRRPEDRARRRRLRRTSGRMA